jgi:hypothetical protein
LILNQNEFLLIFFFVNIAEGGFFKGKLKIVNEIKNNFKVKNSILAHMYFPKEYPLRPPKMKFVTEIWHPNIDQNGDGESSCFFKK